MYVRSHVNMKVDFHCRVMFNVHVNLTRVNKIETMYGRSRANVKVEPRSTFFRAAFHSDTLSLFNLRAQICIGNCMICGDVSKLL